MLERERIRQDLRMIPEEQYQILKTIAKDMMNNNYTAEDKDYILSIIEAQNEDLIEKARLQYPAEERPKKDELLNKLAGHALLDRSTEDSQGIGFVNEFVLGNFCAEVIIEEPSQEWQGMNDLLSLLLSRIYLGVKS